MATLEDVRRLALALPEAEERPSHDGAAAWHIRGKGFVWERPLRRADREALGEAAPDGLVVGVRVADLEAKEALLAAEPGVFFTTPHFDGYPAVLVRMDAVGAGRAAGGGHRGLAGPRAQARGQGLPRGPPP